MGTSLAKLPMLNLAQSYNMFFMLNSTEHEVSITQIQMPKNKELSCFQTLRCYIQHANKC